MSVAELRSHVFNNLSQSCSRACDRLLKNTFEIFVSFSHQILRMLYFIGLLICSGLMQILSHIILTMSIFNR